MQVERHEERDVWSQSFQTGPVEHCGFDDGDGRKEIWRSSSVKGTSQFSLWLVTHERYKGNAP